MVDLYDEFDNEWLCPYCAAPTEPDDKKCPACQRPLWVHHLGEKKRSVWLWRGIFFQYFVALYLIVAGAATLTLLAKLNGISDPIPFWPLYVWLPVDQPAAQSRTLLTVFPRWLFWSFIGLSLYSTGLMILLYRRVRNGNLFYLINGGLTFSLGGLSVLLFYDSLLAAIVGIISMGVGLAQIFIALKLETDFTHQTTRLRLTVDSGINDHASFYLSAREYANLGLWGQAVIHLRRAVVRKPYNLSYQLALAVAYINIKRYDLAQQTLHEAKRLGPDEPDVLRLQQKLERLKGH